MYLKKEEKMICITLLTVSIVFGNFGFTHIPAYIHIHILGCFEKHFSNWGVRVKNVKASAIGVDCSAP